MKFRKFGDRAARFHVAAALVLLWAATAANIAVAESPRHVSRPVSSGFSAEGLAQVRDYMRNEVATGKIPGAVLLIQQHGRRVLLENFGVMDVDSRRPMRSDAIFRAASASRPARRKS